MYSLLYIITSYFRVLKTSLRHYYTSPPAGDIYCFSLRVCPSVRPSVCASVRPSIRLSVTLSCPSHISKNLSCKKFAKKSKNNIPTEVLQRKIKIQFCQKILEVLAKKKHFLNLSRPDLSNYKR